MKIRLRYFLLCIVFGVSIFSCKKESYKILKIKGSDTMLPLLTSLTESYKKNQVKKYKILLEGGGSQTGIEALKTRSCDIAISSKKISAEDSLEIESKTGMKLMEFDIAFDEILIIVNKINKIDSLNFQEIKSIYSGEISNWKDLNGDDLQIKAYSKNENSGLLSFFKSKIMQESPIRGDVKVFENSYELVKEIAKDKSGIGFIGGGHLADSIKVLKIAKDDSLSTYFEPNETNVKARYYPLIIPFRLYYLENKQNEILADMMKYLSSKSARYHIIEEGYIPAIDK